MVRKLSTLVQSLSVVLVVVGLVFFLITVIHFEYTQSQVQLPVQVVEERPAERVDGFRCAEYTSCKLAVSLLSFVLFSVGFITWMVIMTAFLVGRLRAKA